MSQKENPKIACLPNGPYYLLNDLTPKVVPNLQNSEGKSLSNVAGVALCRCGGSNNKPFCDGTHGTNNFSDAKVSGGLPDNRENYVGKHITIHDNRAICAHSGRCTDGLASVFKLKEEPWIDPDGADAKEIIETVRKCPSGALSYSIGGTEAEPQTGELMVTVTKDGPYAISGGIELLGQSFGEGASKQNYTLCRCGGSKNKPFCDGTHWSIGFKDGTD